MMSRKYKIVFEPQAQDWFDKQPEDVQKRVLLILDTISAFPRTAGKQMQNATRWYDDEFGWAPHSDGQRSARPKVCLFCVGKKVLK